MCCEEEKRRWDGSEREDERDVEEEREDIEEKIKDDEGRGRERRCPRDEEWWSAES